MAVGLALLGAPLQAASFNFCWLGAGGYTMTGQIAFPDALLSRPLINQDEVTGFAIAGYLEGREIGRWSMDDRQPGTTWHLRFSPTTLVFPTGGNFLDDASQGWNANGDVDDCGAQGFGFNSGNYAQDFCLHGVWVEQSSIDPTVPLFATTAPVDPACSSTPLLGKRHE